MKILAMQRGHHLCGIRVLTFVKPQRVPAILSPVLPILHQNVDRDPSLAKLGSRIENLLLARVTFAALPKSERPARQHRSGPGEFTVLGYDLGGLRSINEVVVNCFTSF